MNITLSTPLDPDPEQSVQLARLWNSVQLLQGRVRAYQSAQGTLPWAAALQGHQAPCATRAAPPLGLQALLTEFHSLRPLLPEFHFAPQKTYEAVIGQASRQPDMLPVLWLDDAVELVDPVTVLIAPLGSRAQVPGRPYLLPMPFWFALIRDAHERRERLNQAQQADQVAWLSGDAQVGPRLVGRAARSVLRRPGIPLPDAGPVEVRRRTATRLERRVDGWWVVWSFHCPPGALPGPHLRDAVGCDPGVRHWAALASSAGAQIIPAPLVPEVLPASPPRRGFMPLPRDLARAHAELAYHIAEKARPQRDALVSALLAHDVVGVEDVDWTALERRRFPFAQAARLSGLRAALDTVAELGPQLGCTVVRTPAPLSSRTCSACGHLARGRGFGRRAFRCVRCGLCLDRDVNAALNHRRAALLRVGR